MHADHEHMPETSDTTRSGVSVLGLGKMGSALAEALLSAGHPTAVWNRTATKAGPLMDMGATLAATVAEAVAANPLVVVCLYDHASVRRNLDPVVEDLRGHTVLNLTTTTPGQARELAGWAAEHGIGYLDGAIMATPMMIGSREASILYSGPREIFDTHREILDVWATSTYDGADAGMASLFDLAMLSGMYVMFAGFLHGAALTGAAGVPTGEFARRATPFLAAMTEAFREFATVVDGRHYRVPGQSLEWTRPVFDLIARTSEEQGVDKTLITVLRDVAQRQIDAGHGADDLARLYEGLRHPAAAEEAA